MKWKITLIIIGALILIVGGLIYMNRQGITIQDLFANFLPAIIKPQTERFFENCVSITDWVIGGGTTANWGVIAGEKCDASNVDAPSNMTSRAIDLSASNILYANLSFNINTTALDVGEYLRVYANSSATGTFQLVKEFTTNAISFENLNLSKNITLGTGVFIKFTCFNNVVSEHCEIDNITVTSYETAIPQWSSNSTNSTLAGSSILHSVNWTDNTALSGYIFEFDNGSGTFTNNSFVTMTGTTNWSNVTKVVNRTIGTTIQWKVYANNSGNLWNSTNTFSYLTTNNLPTHTNPSITPYSTASTSANVTCSNQSTSDFDGHNVTNIYNWLLNSTSTTLLNMPFDTNVSTNSSGAVKDYSGFSNNGTLNLTENNLSWISNGKIGGAYNFPNNGMINISKSSSLNNTYNFTIEFWAKPVSNANADYILMNSPDGTVNNGEIFLVKLNTGALFISMYNATGSGPSGAQSTGVFSLNNWVHIALVEYSGSNLSLYVNGIFNQTMTGGNAKGPYLTGPNNFYIGAFTTPIHANNFNGTIDNFRIWNSSLTAEQVNMLYLEGNNNLTNSTIVSQETTTGQNWTCQVTPNDVYGDGITKINSTIISEIDTTTPQYSNIQVNDTNPAILDAVNFSVLWTDNVDLSSYIFEWNATGVSCNTVANDSTVLFTGTTNWSNISKQIPATCLIGNVPFIAWRVYANDSSNNKNATPLTFSFSQPPADSCTYTSGNWNVVCNDNCTITSNVAGDGSNLSLSGSGNFNINANISGFSYIFKENACYVNKLYPNQIIK